MTCHSDDFNTTLKQKVCEQCHTSFPPTGADDLVAVPPLQGNPRHPVHSFRTQQHVDPKARIDAKTGFRADCTFCHKFDPKGLFATFPAHEAVRHLPLQAGHEAAADRRTDDRRLPRLPHARRNRESQLHRSAPFHRRTSDGEREVCEHRIFTCGALQGERPVRSPLHHLPLCHPANRKHRKSDAAEDARLRAVPRFRTGHQGRIPHVELQDLPSG